MEKNLLTVKRKICLPQVEKICLPRKEKSVYLTGKILLDIQSPALLGFFRAEAIYFTHGSVMIRIQSLDLDLVGIILDAIHDGVSKRIVITANALIPTFIEEL